MEIHFISGLPRSGSTLLANLLAQNPRFHSTATSGILEILFLVRNGWDKVLEFRAAVDRAENEAEKVRVLRGILQAYHAERGRPVVFDKSRSWLAHLELAEKLVERPAKVLVNVTATYNPANPKLYDVANNTPDVPFKTKPKSSTKYPVWHDFSGDFAIAIFESP